jgi:hypothetical protein
MTVLSNSIEIGATPEAVFDYASDMTNELEWNPKIVSMERLDHGPVTVGSRYRAEWPGSGPAMVEVTAVERPHRWTSFSRGRGLDIAFEGRVAPAGSGSRLTVMMDLRPRGVMKVAAPLLARAMQRTEARNLPALRDAIERRQQTKDLSGPAPI